jgi:hypothetical protein
MSPVSMSGDASIGRAYVWWFSMVWQQSGFFFTPLFSLMALGCSLAKQKKNMSFHFILFSIIVLIFFY